MNRSNILFQLLCTCILFSISYSFQLLSPNTRIIHRISLQMSWSFSNAVGVGTMKEEGLIGNDKEYYFSPQHTASIIGPKNICGKQIHIPILPYTSVILPGSCEQMNIFEMRHRQLFNDVEQDDVFGVMYLSQTHNPSRISLVGTLCQVKSRRVTDDGHISALIEGMDRFYLEEVKKERPYFKGVVRTFKDFTEKSPDALDRAELMIFNEVQINLKMMELLLPQRNFSIIPALIENLPQLKVPGVRDVQLHGDKHDIRRRTKFSYAVMEMLQSQPSLKLALMQEHVVERRYADIYKVLKSGGNYLRNELRVKGLIADDQQIDELRQQVYEGALSARIDADCQSDWIPENFKDGSWVQMATMM